MASSPPSRNLLLIGLRASGKTTLARAVAQRRRAPCIDLDRSVLADMNHPTVADAWNAEGEPAFRRAETRALRVALGSSPAVIALGGGTPTAPGAADLIRDAQRAGTAIVVYLRCTPGELRSRLQSPAAHSDDALRDRPSLTGRPPLDEIAEVYAARDPLYRELADHVLENVGSLDEGLAALDPLW